MADAFVCFAGDGLLLVLLDDADVSTAREIVVLCALADDGDLLLASAARVLPLDDERAGDCGSADDLRGTHDVSVTSLLCDELTVVEFGPFLTLAKRSTAAGVSVSGELVTSG